MEWAIRVAGVAVAYWLVGRLALFMAIPPGYATAVWPAAGLALVCVLLWGWRVAPGILVGSFLVNVGTSFDASSARSVVASLEVAVAIAGGASLQAVGGASLIRRVVGFPTPLEGERDILGFAALGGPVSCLISPTIGVATLCAAGIVPWSSYLFSWSTWWVGDSIGVLIFAPLALLVVAGPSALWRRRRALVGAPLLIGFAAVTALFVRASAWEETRLRGEFEQRVVPLASALQDRLSYYEEVLSSVASLLQSVPAVDRGAFREFTRRVLAQYPGIHGLGWNPRVTDLERTAYEEAARRDGLSGFEFTEMDLTGRLRRASRRATYAPAFFLEPEDRNRAALGFDSASDPARRRALEEAAASRQPIATPPIQLVQTTGDRTGVLLVVPVFSLASSSAASSAASGAGELAGAETVRGHAVGVFRIHDVVEPVLDATKEAGIDLRLVDETHRDGSGLLWARGPVTAIDPRRPDDGPSGARRWSRDLQFGGRTWTLYAKPTAAYLGSHRSWLAWMVLAGGLFFVSLLGVLMLVITGRAAQAKRALDQRTDEAERAQEAEETFRLALDAAPTGMLMVDRSGEIVLVNRQVDKLLGYERDQLIGRRVETLLPERLRGRYRAEWADFSGDLRSRPMGSGDDLHVVHKDGTEVPVEIGLNPLKTPKGDFVLSSIADMTERKQAAEQFRLAIDASPTGMIMVDRRGTIVLVNAQIEHLFGYVRKELIGQPIEILLPERHRDEHPASRAHFLAHPGFRPMGSGREIFGRRKDGSEVSVEIALNPLKTAEGDFVLSSVVDINQRKRAEREREDLMRRLRAFNAELEERVGVRTRELTASLREREVLLQEVHHRVKNNLQVISSLINMQGRKVEAGPNRDALQECQTRVQAIAFIHEKLYQSRDYARVPFSEYIRGLAGSIFHATGVSPANITLELALEDLALAVDQAIPCGLILNELITNALKHGFPDGRAGTIRIELARADNNRLRLAVTDDGAGLPEAFDIQQTDSLGLQLVCTLAEQLEAAIEVNGHGATSFQLTFQNGSESALPDRTPRDTGAY